MKIKNCLISALVLILGMSSAALAKDKKHPPQRGMLERMEAVPCGARQKGIAGVGSVFASAGVTRLNSEEKLCQQYLLRTDDMEYHIRPVNAKHAAVLPVGQEAVFKIKKDRLYLRMADEDRKAKPFQVVAMKPLNSESDGATSAQREPANPDSRPVNKTVQPPPTKPANAENASGQNPGPGR